MAVFLWQGISYILDERGIRSRAKAASWQRSSIVATHVLGFALLTAKGPGFNLEALKLGGYGLAILILGFALARFFFKGSCPLMWNGMFMLMDIGLITLARLDPGGVPHQALCMAIGLGATLAVPIVFMIIPKFEKLEFIYLLAGMTLVVLPFFIGNRQNGSLNWVDIRGFNFQPSEAAKFLYILFLGSVLRKKLNFWGLIYPAVSAALFVLALTLQNDLGGALIFFMAFMIMLYISTGKAWLFAAGMLAASAASYAAFKALSHVQTRVAAWLNPWNDPFDKGHQILQSLFAIGTWGFLGSGLGRGSPGYVPVVKSDLIFAAICEEFGGLYGLALIGVYIMIFYRGLHIALRSQRPYYSLLASGFTSILAIQTFLIIGGNIKFIPLTGVTLPFVSAGGSSAIVCIAMIGILQFIYGKSEPEEKEAAPAEVVPA
jgi:cell division protein FtsW (lipid II flippase)